MSKPRDRQPLDGEASPDLNRVLEALREDGPSSDEMQRMAHKLDAWLETPAAASGQGQGLRSRPLGKVGLGVLASGALLALLPYLLRNSSPHDQPPESVAAPHAPAPALSGTAPSGTAPAPIAAPAPQPSLHLQPAPALRAPQPRQAAEPEVTRGTRTAARKHSARAHVAGPAAPERPGLEAVSPAVPLDRAVTAGTAASSSGTAEPEDSATPAAAASSPAASAAAHETPTTSQAASPTQAAVASTRHAPDARAQDTEHAAVSRALPLDEAGLLQRARQLARERPAEALRLLDEHKRRFARGMLAPEREVLAIEILRAQQRNAEARARLSTFRAQYPDSVYLERLEHP